LPSLPRPFYAHFFIGPAPRRQFRARPSPSFLLSPGGFFFFLLRSFAWRAFPLLVAAPPPPFATTHHSFPFSVPASFEQELTTSSSDLAAFPPVFLCFPCGSPLHPNQVGAHFRCYPQSGFRPPWRCTLPQLAPKALPRTFFLSWLFFAAMLACAFLPLSRIFSPAPSPFLDWVWEDPMSRCQRAALRKNEFLYAVALPPFAGPHRTPPPQRQKLQPFSFRPRFFEERS